MKRAVLLLALGVGLEAVIAPADAFAQVRRSRATPTPAPTPGPRLPLKVVSRKDRLDLSVGIALGSASQIALFVAPVLVLLSYFIGPTPMDLQFWPGAVIMMLIATLTASLVTNSGRSAWFVGVLVLMVYLIFALTLYLLPPKVG